METIQCSIVRTHHMNISNWKFTSYSWANICLLKAFDQALWITTKSVTSTGTRLRQRHSSFPPGQSGSPLALPRALEMSALRRAPKCSCLWGFNPSHSLFLPSSFTPTKSWQCEQAAVVREQGLQALLWDFLIASLQQVWLIFIFFMQISLVDAIYIWW